MLKIQKVTKKFKKIKAINNTSLEFDQVGLISLLGPSGCGKTTILNTVGGLDNINKGKIFIDNKKLSSSKKDKIRNEFIGYIFQDYKLIENISVFDNISLVLKMIGIKDKKIIKERVEYVLNIVGMLRFKRRPAGMLSGGEKQRVAIARAIVKNPKILLCDEPTGNLDSKNSLEVMKIIKSISKDKLVILVTHEQKLAKFYADRIIEIKDGIVVNDYMNNHSNDLDYELENNIYLKDMNRHDKISDGTYGINLFMNKDETFNLDIVYKNGNIYIKSNSGEKIEVVDNDTSIEFVDGHYKSINKDEINNYKFDTKILENNKVKYSSIMNPFKHIIEGFKKLFNYSKMKKLLLLGFLAAGAIVMTSLSMLYAGTKIDDTKFVNFDKEYMQVFTKNNKIKEYEKQDFIDYLIPNDSKFEFEMPLNFYIQSNDSKINFKNSVAGKSDKLKIINGSLTDKKYDIILDKELLKKLNKYYKNLLKNVGIFEVEDLIGLKVNHKRIEFTISGISDNGSPSVYMDKSILKRMYVETHIHDIDYYEAEEDKIELKEGVLPINDKELIIDIDQKETFKKEGYKVVGYYTSKYGVSKPLANINTIYYSIASNSETFTIMPKNREKFEKYFSKEYFINTYEFDKKSFLEQNKNNRKMIINTSIILLAIVGFEILMMIRASFLSRVKEVGILRAIGVKKSDIYIMFMGEIIAITTLFNLPAILFTYYCIINIEKIEMMDMFIDANIYLLILAIIISFVFNIIVGLMPVFETMRKTPAAILSRQDVD